MKICLVVVLQFCGLICMSQHDQPIPYAPELFPKGISGAVCGFSGDGNTIYFAREDTVVDQIHLFTAVKSRDGWTNVQLLPFSGKHGDLGGRLSRDGSIFYFTSDRPGGSSNPSDAWNIWQTSLTGNEWSTPRPIASMNDKGLECCPLPLRDGTVMFSSDRERAKSWWISVWDPSTMSEVTVGTLNETNTWQWPSSLNKKSDVLFLNSMKRPDTRGMDDIYVSFYEDAGWSKPVNIGPAINTTEYEDGAILSPDEKLLIFCRHATSTTPSQVLCVKWKPTLKSLKKERR